MDYIKSQPNSSPNRWICIYPLYINSKKTLAEGRRIKKEKGVENPTSQEIFDILQHAGLNCKLEVGILNFKIYIFLVYFFKKIFLWKMSLVDFI